jgi:uncharacterized protein YpiB (UPF0302 family)
MESIKKNFLEFFLFSEDELFRNALWILGNLAFDFHFTRVMFYEENLYEKIQFILINSLTDKELIERMTWLLVNVTRGNMADFQTKVINHLII